MRLDFVYSLEYLIRKMIDPGEEFPVEEKPILKIADFKHVFEEVSPSIVDTLAKQ